MTLMCRRRRKMMRLRRMMLRRKTDPKTGKHTLCGPAQATCACTFHNSHVAWKFTIIYRNNGRGTRPATLFCASLRNRNAARTGDKSHFVWKFIGQTTGDTCGDIVLCEPATCAWTFHKSPCCIEIYQKNRTPPRTSFCASLRSRNAHGHFTRAILC